MSRVSVLPIGTISDVRMRIASAEQFALHINRCMRARLGNCDLCTAAEEVESREEAHLGRSADLATGLEKRAGTTPDSEGHVIC